MDVLLLSRLQFAAACFFHFLFVPLTLGLSVLLAIMETQYVRTGDREYRRMARFWGRIFVVNFAVGVVTGITLEFQLGTNWSRYSAYVGDIFGSLLAIEATVAFFLESTFLAVWMFGWKRLSPKMHAFCIWVVALASTFSAFWILVANAWMQHPVGYKIVFPQRPPNPEGGGGLFETLKSLAESGGLQGRAELDGLGGFLEIITQPTAILAFFHTVMGAFILSGFFVMGVSAWHLRKKQHQAFFERSFRFGCWFAMIFTVLELVAGHFSGTDVAKKQPAKLAAMESLWESENYAAQTLFLIPDPKNERNLVEFVKIKPILSLLAYGRPEAHVKGLKDFRKEDRPPVQPVFWAFRTMVGLGFLFPFLPLFGLIWRKTLVNHPRYLRLVLWAIPLPYVAIQAGWVVTEVGRQPWIVTGLMRTSNAVSPIAASQVALSLAGFILMYTTLGLIAFFLIARIARKGPEEETAAPAENEIQPPAGPENATEER